MVAFLRRLFNRDKKAPTEASVPPVFDQVLDVSIDPDTKKDAEFDDTIEILQDTDAQTIELEPKTLVSGQIIAQKRDAAIVDIGYSSHVGSVRKRNEDSALVLTTTSLGESALPAFGLFIIADGMGGHSDGQKASQLAARIVAQQVMNKIYPAYLNVENREPSQPVQDILGDALQKANWQVYEANSESGTTCTSILLVGNRLYAAHVGDSRAYLIRENDEQVELLTVDHSFVQRLQDAGQITAAEASVHPQRNILYRAIGQGEKLDIDTFSRSLVESCTLLMCSDGLWGLVPSDIIRKIALAAPMAQQACD
ncbi:MAG: serine/threonine-protein phosphatase, partial [Anaerolineales bacterium]|nr:serine/threonine-protein phosphatase [Anaerolineales bacterium]